MNPPSWISIFIIRNRNIKKQSEVEKMKGIHIGEVLVEQGVITKEQLDEGLKLLTSEKNDRRLGEVLTELGYVNESVLLEVLGRSMGIEVVDLEFLHVDEHAVEKIPKQLALKYNILAVAMEGSSLTVVTADPLDLYALEDIRLVTNMRIQTVLASRTLIRSAIELNYSGIDARTAARIASEHAVFSRNFAESLALNAEEDQAPIVRLLNSLLLKAYNTNASDIHIEPYENETVVRMRRDGMLIPYMTLSPAIHQGIVARTKILAKMDIAEKRRAQDGHFKITLDEKEMNVRVSFVPTIHGEKGVLRFLTTNTEIDRVQSFGMSEENCLRMKRLLKIPHGIIYFTGPTGSGKTTTLYSILQYLSSGLVNIVTIEDPVERNLPKINQIQVNERAGLSFQTGLRSILRQDPDIIMIGETRDGETAEISARAAITGHLVFSTLHTNDAASAVTRLLDMGIPPYLAAASMAGVVSQRLMRKVCPHCAQEYEAGPEEKKILYGKSVPAQEGVRLRRGKGCYLCNDTGYKGRIAIHEIMGVDRVMKGMIGDGRNDEELKSYAIRSQGMATLREEAAKLVLAGITTLEEMERIIFTIDMDYSGEN